MTSPSSSLRQSGYGYAFLMSPRPRRLRREASETKVGLTEECDTAGMLQKRRFRGLVVAVARRRQTRACVAAILAIDVSILMDFIWGVPAGRHAGQ
jgi:hypothetical protein